MSERIAVCFTSFHLGGIERVILDLLEEFLGRGNKVDPLLCPVSGHANTIDPKALFAAPAVTQYFREYRRFLGQS